MAPPNYQKHVQSNHSSIDSKSGFCSETNTYHSIRPAVPLPRDSTPISLTSFLFSLLNSHPPPPDAAAIIDAVTCHRVLYSDFLIRIKTLAVSLRAKFDLSKGDVAFVLSPNSVHIPVLYLSLLSLGVVVSPSNPSGTEPEILQLVRISKPVIAFSTSDSAHKIPSLKHGTVILDSAKFESLVTSTELGLGETDRVRVQQSDTAAILYSSGTTGMVKGVALSHRNWIASLAGADAVRKVREPSHTVVVMCTVPYFHVYGFRYMVTALAMGETVVFTGTGRFDLGVMLRAIQDLKVRHVAVAPPVLSTLASDGADVVMDGYDLSSLEVVGCGGAPLTRAVIEKFKKRLPKVQIAQAYGLTESAGRVFATVGPEECQVVGATGKLMSNCQAKIVDPETAIALPPGKPGHIWLRGAFIMKGYVGDEAATAAVLDPEGWLRTGDLGYIDKEGFLFYVDRIKELIKYKGYQVAPAELEHLLHSHPHIVDAAVVPYPDEQAGQVPVAFVVRKHGSTIHESEIKDYIAKQMDTFVKLPWKCSDDGVLFRDFIEERRIFTFLLGLNDNLDEVRDRILGKKPLPTIREVVSEVRREESRRRVMLSKSDVAEIKGEASALAAARGNPNQMFDNRQRRNRPWCDHCRKPGHVKDTYWKIHGKPQDWKPKNHNDKDAKGYTASRNEVSGSDRILFSPEQMEQLQKIFSGMHTAVVGAGSVAKTGHDLGEDDWNC